MLLGRSRSLGVCEQYRVNLVQRIEQGDSDLVCRDKELCEKMEEMLREGAARDVHTATGLDPLAVMEASLHTPPVWGHAVGGLTSPTTAPGLGALARAFEVLERAALNLYLCPWRKEYRVVKMFSGMFTHLVRPALSEQQVGDLFWLLGYLANGEELKLHSPPHSTLTLLHLACAFFAARCECRLLLSAAGKLGGGANAERHLVQERQRGHCLQEALDSLQRKMEATQWGCVNEAELDLYTAEGPESNGEREVTSIKNPTTVPMFTDSETLSFSGSSTSSTLKHQSSATSSLGSNTNHSLNEYPRGGSGIPSESRPSGDGRMGMSQGRNQVCRCLDLPTLYIYQCLQCLENHSVDCHILVRCREKRHPRQLSNDTDLHRHKVGGASATAWDLPKEGGASATLRVEPREGRAPRTQRQKLGVHCGILNCQEPVFKRCSTCDTEICEKCFGKHPLFCASRQNLGAVSTPV